MGRLEGLLNGSLSITAYDPPSVRGSRRDGRIDIYFKNYPLDAEHVQMMNDTVLQLIERGVEPPDGPTTA
jgi:hypothetical protein